MQTFKQADLLINTGLLAVFTIIVLVNPSLLFTSYWIVGAWQLVSMFIHFRKGWFLKKGTRNRYHWTTCIILLVLLLSQLVPPFRLVYFLLLLGFPVLAVIYTTICYDELKELKTSHSFSLR